jgi:Type ISP C-terminal specificity domain
MARLSPDRLRQVRTIDDMLEYLTDELDWPVDADDLEEATFDYSPEELGIAASQMPRLKSLRELRPLSAKQPWGIFFIEFSGPRLPITPLRRLLQSLVTKKRARLGSSHRTWQLDDLLFIITTDSGVSVELHLVAFFQSNRPTLEIRSLPWRPQQSPTRHLRRLATELLPMLAWPDDQTESSQWREQWRQAFKLRHGEAIGSAARLAERMAHTGIALRTQIDEALSAEHGTGPFSALLEEVRTELVADVDAERFADMCAQTLVYGVLSSRVTDPLGFGASPNLSVVPLSNPFLSAFFEQVHDQSADLDLEGSGLEQLVADLRETNVEAILDQFGSTTKGGDPVIHFYEEFLTRYDRKMRADAGAFYTPQPVVRFMVRAIDELLRTRFGLAEGVADTSAWRDVAKKTGVSVPEGVDPNSPFISMVDPATGTGTFLVEWLRQARRSFVAAHPKADWPGRLREHVLPQMHAFELMLGPYAIAHLKVALELHDQGVADGEATILLTDTLDHPAAEQRLPTMTDPVANEGERAAELKDHARFTVCIGNPPYDREQRDRGAGYIGKRKGGVVRYGVPGVRPLLEDVLQPLLEAGLGQHAKNLYNDYVYFWRWATWQTTDRRPGPGVVAFITASSYLDGVSMGGLRHHLRSAFDELWIIDLGGEGRGARPEENVFDIRTPVAVAFGMRLTAAPPSGRCRVRYVRVLGSREEKFAKLDGLTLQNERFTDVDGLGIDSFTPRGDTDYRSWTEITDLFPWIHSGCQVKRTWPIGPSRAVLEHRWSVLCETPAGLRAMTMKETRDRTLAGRVKPLLTPGMSALRPVAKLTPGDSPEGMERYGYRSLDRQWVIADNRIADFPRPDLWAVRGKHQVFLATLTSTKLGRGPAVTVSPYVPDLDYFSGRGAKNVMPLWRDARGRQPNVTRGLLAVLAEILAGEVSAEDLVAYVYALTGTPAFSRWFHDELDEGAGPVRVPITADRALFDRAVALGRDLLWWHTWGERFTPSSAADLPPGTARELEAVRGYPDKYRHDAATGRLTVGTGAFGPVSKDIFDFEVSGLKVVQSWLAYRMAERKGRRSSPLDDIRPQRWTFSEELLKLLGIIEHTVEVTPIAAELITDIINQPLLDPSVLPTPTEAERRPPKE